MTTRDLARALASAPAGGDVSIEAGEFRGPLTIDRPLSVTGAGLATVLWAPVGPVVTVRAPGVRLRHLAIEVTYEDDGVALLADPAGLDPGLAGVRLCGRAEGLAGGRRWYVPPLVDLGSLAPGGTVQRILTCELPGPPTVDVQLDGLRVDAGQGAGGRTSLRLALDSASFPPGSLIEGRIEVAAGGMMARVRVTGVVVATGQPAGDRPGGSTLAALDRALDRSGGWPRPSSSPRERPAEGAGGDPDRVGAHEEQARLLERQDRHDEALALWRSVLAIDPRRPGAAVRAARCCNRLQRFDEAIEVLETALAAGGASRASDLYRALAIAYHQVGRREEALWALDRSQNLRFDPRLAALRLSWQQSAPGAERA